MSEPDTNSTQPTTTKLVITITSDLKKEVTRKAKKKFGNRKSAVSLYVEMLLRDSLKLNINGVEPDVH